jgi:hypothetical protein
MAPKPTAFVATSLIALGCSFGSFDYLSTEYGTQAAGGGGATSPTALAGDAGAEASVGGSTEPPELCRAQRDGTTCDDHDACTRTSRCTAGSCRGEGDHPCVVADSVRDFSMTQGLEGFWYGAWSAGSDGDGAYQPDVDFQQLVACPDSSWRPSCVAEKDPGFRWTLIMAELQHAATLPMLELPVRRWISDVSGPVNVALDHHHADPGEGDGTRAQLLVDGQLLWENEISGSDAAGKQVTLPLDLKVGTRLELVLHPRANEARDMTHLSMVVTGQ